MKVRYILMTAAVALVTQGCSDWDDHYDANSSTVAGADATLWEQINSRQELSNFASLLKKVGYDEALSTNQSYTVWAPQNDGFDFEKYNALSDSLLKAEFLNNHIARGYHRASGNIEERVHLLNKKVMDFEGNKDYTLGNLAVNTPNILSKNGLLHMMDQALDFRPNFYEFFLRNHEDGFQTSSLGSIFESNMVREIDKDKSVEGPMKDGERTYLDTVYVESNKMFDGLNAKLTDEDSTYTMIIPSDEAWAKAYKHVEQYFNFPSSIQPFTITNNEKTGALEYTIAGAVDVDKDSLKNQYTTRNILGSLIFSNTVNPCLKGGNKPAAATDSIESTWGNVICNTLNYQSPTSSQFNDATDMFRGTTKQVLSNGVAWLTGDSIYLKPWAAWCPVYQVRAQNGTYQAGTESVSLTENVTVGAAARNPNVEGSMHATAYYQVSSSVNARPQVYMYGPKLRSTSYAVYLTMVPANITDTTAVPTTQRIQLRSVQHTANGNAPRTLSPAALKRSFTSNSNMAAVSFDYGTKEKSKILTKFMGVFKPNINYWGIVSTPAALPVFNIYCSTTTAGGSTVLRIAGITFVPQEAVEYYMNQGVIDSYTDEMPEIFWNLNRFTY